MSTFFADLHCHSAMFPYNQDKHTVWHEHKHWIYPSQGDFIKLSKGGVRVLFLSLCPVEQGFLTFKKFSPGTGNFTDFLARLIIKMPKERSDEIQNYNHKYFKDLKKEYKFLKEDEDPHEKNVCLNLFKRKKFKYKIVSNFDELKTILNFDKNLNPNPASDNTIAVILTIEGASALGVGQRNTITKDYTQLKPIIIKNISKLKNLDLTDKKVFIVRFLYH